MRTDARIDRKQVRVPNVPFMGYNRPYARHGFLVVWNDNGQKRLCRVVGRIAYASELGSKEQNTYSPAIKNHLFLAVLNDSLSSVYIRWVNPDEIVECYNPKDYLGRIKSKLSRFLSSEFIQQSPLQIGDELEKG